MGLLGIAIALAWAGTVQAGSPRRARLVPMWRPQAQFAGYYVADAKGIYLSNGIAATILVGGPDRPPLDMLTNGAADFAVLWLASALQEHARGLPLVNVAQLLQHSGLMLIAKKTAGITRLSDLNGKKIGVWAGTHELQPRALFSTHNLTVTFLPQSYSVNLFLRDAVQATAAMWYNEYHTILSAGYDPEELTTFRFSDHGLDLPEDGIYTLARTLARNPALCRDFVRASLAGWQYAFAHEDEALDIVLARMESAHVPANRAHQRWMLRAIKTLMRFDHDGNIACTLNPADYNGVAALLQRDDATLQPPDFTAFHHPATAACQPQSTP
jgi:NitT/TauT family transport system substrate-binding protein